MEPAPALDLYLPFAPSLHSLTFIAHFSLFMLFLAHVLSPVWVLIQVGRDFSCYVDFSDIQKA